MLSNENKRKIKYGLLIGGVSYLIYIAQTNGLPTYAGLFENVQVMVLFFIGFILAEVLKNQ